MLRVYSLSVSEDLPCRNDSCEVIGYITLGLANSAKVLCLQAWGTGSGVAYWGLSVTAVMKASNINRMVKLEFKFWSP